MADNNLERILVHMVIEEAHALAFDKDNLPEVEIGGGTFCVVAVREDVSLHSADHSATLTHDYASRILIDCVPKPVAKSETDLQVLKIAAHVFVTVRDDRSKVIVDTDSLRQKRGPAAVQSPQPLCAHEMSQPGSDSSSSHTMSASALQHKYAAYIDAINGRNMAHTLPDYCHDMVTHNGAPLALSEYRRLMEDAQGAIPDLHFSIAGTVVDRDRQMLAAQLDFWGTPTGLFAGAMPREGAGREVRFSEIVFYWFRDGKIARVVSLVDLDAYRKQVTR